VQSGIQELFWPWCWWAGFVAAGGLVARRRGELHVW
jgi:hypothetical protein